MNCGHMRLGFRLLILILACVVASGCEKAMKEANERQAEILKKSAGKADAEKDRQCLRSFFAKSLHYTGEGMRYWYEEQGGFMNVTGIPYDNLDCKNCHVQSCDHCHAKQDGDVMAFSKDKVRDMKTCLPCHGREGLTFKFDRAAGGEDVHTAAGMVCADCHFGGDVHGDGKSYDSMRSPGGVKIGCEKCHVDASGGEAPAFDPDTDSHSAHGDLLACQACHVSNTTACMNCHFDAFLATGKRKGNFFPMKEWILLVNHEGKVTSGSAMSLVYEKKKFLAYVPYYTHSVTAEGRACEDCHDNEAVRLIAGGGKVPVMAFENGKVVNWSGVVPLVPEQLDFVFLDKDKKGWRPLPADDPVMVQMAAHGEPLCAEQLERLAQDMGE